jgi:hypothetical protein
VTIIETIVQTPAAKTIITTDDVTLPPITNYITIEGPETTQTVVVTPSPSATTVTTTGYSIINVNPPPITIEVTVFDLLLGVIPVISPCRCSIPVPELYKHPAELIEHIDFNLLPDPFRCSLLPELYKHPVELVEFYHVILDYHTINDFYIYNEVI